MLNFVKKLLILEKKKDKNGFIKDEEIDAISDEEAKEFLTKLPMESLIDLNRNINEIYLRKELFNNKNGFIACIGQPGHGKSSLCSAFYKIFFGINKEIFNISWSCSTKGLWIIKESIRQSIKENIIKDIIDVEGFQDDELSKWKYIMIVAFIATDIIIVNRNYRYRYDYWKKILNFIWYSLEKMDNLGLSKMVKNIWIQIYDEEDIQKFGEIMDSIDNSPKKWEKKGIKLNIFYIDEVSKKDLKKVKGNILEVEDYVIQAKEVFEKILNLPEYESISTLLPYIDNFNNVMNGKDSFNKEYIEDIIKKDFTNAYTIIKNSKEAELLKDFSDKLIPPKTSNESFEEFINRQNIHLSFYKDEVRGKFSFLDIYISTQFDEIYNKLMEGKDFKADPNIFKDKYNLFIEKIKKEEERSDIYNRFQKKQIKINDYFNQLKFYEYIESYSSSKYNIDINYEYENDLKNEYNHKIIDYYYKKKEEKKQQWEKQIDEAKYLRALECVGYMKCVNGHEITSNNVGCGSCKEKGIDFNDRLLYWVDVDEHYGICKHCNVVRKISEKIACGTCGGESYCKVKFI